MDETLDKVVRSPRLAARRRAVRAARRRRWRRAVVALIVAGGLAAGGIALSRSPFFDLARVEVLGATNVDPAEVVRASGLSVGDNLLSLDLTEIAARVERIPGVSEARVERDGSLGVRITILERAPAVAVRSGDRRWHLDARGQRVNGKARPDEPVPVIQIPRRGGTVLPRGAVASVLAVWDAMPEGLRASSRSFTPAADGTLTMRVGETVVLFGRADRVQEKIEAIQLVRARARTDGRRLTRLDVRVPERPAARLA